MEEIYMAAANPFLPSSQGEPDHLSRYQQDGYTRIEGWLGDGIFPVLRVCAAVQSSLGERGGALEIGVHHGRFFIALNQLASADEPSLAIDVFDAQHLNVDHSGGGSRQAFENNLRWFCRHRGKNVSILPADSTTLTAPDILRLLPLKPRLFSVDGGHTAEHTIHDLRLANDCLSNVGVIFLDDFLNPEWIGVTEGACRYLSAAPTIVPFALCSNKLLLCRISVQQYFLQAFREHLAVRKEVTFFGKTLLVC
jgi:hypothetical protein